MKQSLTDTQRHFTLFTVKKPLQYEIVVRRSRFIAYLYPISTKDEAVAVLHKVKKEHWNAVHHCYAYRLGVKGLEYRMSDDGEPSGTAGKPILFALQKASLTNVIIVVVRYFGGVKLGVGPLARAYLDAASQVIDTNELIPITPMASLDVHCMYDDVSRVIGVFEEAGAQFEPTYADAVTFSVVVDASKAPFITSQVIERTNSRAGFSNLSIQE